MLKPPGSLEGQAMFRIAVRTRTGGKRSITQSFVGFEFLGRCFHKVQNSIT
jgi:hypothetical protein